MKEAAPLRVNVAQLVPNCVVIEDVLGKSGRPLIQKNTVLTEQHLLILDKFLVEDVAVSNKLADGTVFKPKEIEARKPKEKLRKPIQQEPVVQDLTFTEHYQLVVEAFKEEFSKWERQSQIDLFRIRSMILPLFERVEAIGLNVFFLHHHARKNHYIYHHCVSLGLLSFYLAQRMGLTKKEAIQVGLSGLLSDAGLAKVNVPFKQKYQPLLHIEDDEIKKHPTLSYRLIESEKTLSQEQKLAILQHHERLDGSGFPLGVESDKVHLFARIIGLCDEYHASLCEAQFTEKPSLYHAIKRILDARFTKFDPKVVQAFIDTIAGFLMGAHVKLSNGQTAKIIFIDQNNLLYPMVQLVDQEQIIALEQERQLYIADVILEW